MSGSPEPIKSPEQEKTPEPESSPEPAKSPDPEKTAEPEKAPEPSANEESSTNEESSANEDASADNENSQAIDNFSNEYVAPFLAADFSNLMTDESAVDATEQDDEGTDKNKHGAETELDDIDAILAEAALDNAQHETVAETNDAEIDDDTLSALESDFDESTLTQLLSEEEESSVDNKLSSNDKEFQVPDFTDSGVLADLLNEQNTQASNTNSNAELDDMEQLDAVEFDELLADIAEETADSDNGNEDASNENTSDKEMLVDIGDDLIGDDLIDNTQTVSLAEDAEKEKDFVDVDNLIEQGMDDMPELEPYDKENIDVGLDEFPEFKNEGAAVDVDAEDASGVAEQLDLAKVYLEMDDQDSAEPILDKIMQNGNDEQKTQAKKLLEQFS